MKMIRLLDRGHQWCRAKSKHSGTDVWFKGGLGRWGALDRGKGAIQAHTSYTQFGTYALWWNDLDCVSRLQTGASDWLCRTCWHTVHAQAKDVPVAITDQSVQCWTGLLLCQGPTLQPPRLSSIG